MSIRTSGEKDLIEIIEFCAQYPDHVFAAGAPYSFYERRLGELGMGRFSDKVGDYFHRRPHPKKTLLHSLLRVAEYFQVPATEMLLDPVTSAANHSIIGLQGFKFGNDHSHRIRTKAEREKFRNSLAEELSASADGRSLNSLCRNAGITQSTAVNWFPEQAKALVLKRKETRDARRRHAQAKLNALTAEDLMRPDLQDAGWHRIPHIIAVELGVSVYKARQRIDELRKDMMVFPDVP